jgi:hypothetical protein
MQTISGKLTTNTVDGRKADIKDVRNLVITLDTLFPIFISKKKNTSTGYLSSLSFAFTS